MEKFKNRQAKREKETIVSLTMEIIIECIFLALYSLSKIGAETALFRIPFLWEFFEGFK